MSSLAPPVLDVTDLHVSFRVGDAEIHAVNGASVSVHAGETVCVVGESGSGKSVTAMAIMGLLPGNAKVAARHMRFAGQDLLRFTEHGWRQLRGNEIGMIFQDPMSSLNPAHTIGMQIAEGVIQHRGLDHRAARQKALQVLDLVRIPDAAQRLGAYPHELSGGMRQRVMIAMALICEPRLLIADEPTAALDVTIQAQILTLMDDLRRDMGISILLITHDLGVVADIADRVVVMYGGGVAESAPVETLFDRPAHPYTLGLMRAMPSFAGARADRLAEIPGSVPRLMELPRGCAFAPRCGYAKEPCLDGAMPLLKVSSDHATTCQRHAEITGGLQPSPQVQP